MATKEVLRKKLEDMIHYLTPFLPLVNSHVVNFITDNQWDNTVPENLRAEFSTKGFENITNLLWRYHDDPTCLSDDVSNSPLVQHFIEAQKMSLTSQPNLCLSLNDLQTKLASLHCKEHTNLKISRLMSEKKSYEVDVMSQVVLSMVSATDCSHIVDIGGGKAYLSSNLSLQHNLKVLSIDQCRGNTHGAAERLERLKKVWNRMKYNAENPYEGKKGKNWKSKKKIPAAESTLNFLNSEAAGNPLFKQRTEFITSTTDIRHILRDSFPGDSISGAGLVGLHTCGNLASAHLRIFVQNLNVFKFLLNIGCCYHLIQEEFSEDKFWNEIKACTEDQSEPGFPMSSFLREREFFLSRNPRMLATQSPERVLHERKLVTVPLFYRSLLQVLLTKKSNGDDFPYCVVGRLALKCTNFTEYALKAVKKIGLKATVTEDELDELYRSHYHHFDRIQMFFLIRVGLSPVLESLILLDRLLYLHEQGVEDSFIAQIFDPVKSPRCYAIISIRKDDSRDGKS
nr:PREDICTED: methyltransferase-like protein 25 [Bemisia tabaci]